MHKQWIAAVVMAMAPLAATSAWAQEEDPVWYLRGSFNDWGLTDMDEISPGHFQATVTGLTPDEDYYFKVATDDWEDELDWPGADVRVLMDDTGELTVNFFPEPADDGWLPEGPRVGYNDLGWNWEIMGSLDEWTAPLVSLTDLGDGVHQGELVVPEAGDYWAKFRMEDSWDISAGMDFGHFSDDIHFVTEEPDQNVTFTIDLPNGRLQVLVDDTADILVGDMNFDGQVNTADVAPFVLALTDQPTYLDTFDVDEDDMIAAGDINGDGKFNTADVAPFVQLLVDAGHNAANVPEPGSLALLGGAALTLLRRRRDA